MSESPAGKLPEFTSDCVLNRGTTNPGPSDESRIPRAAPMTVSMNHDRQGADRIFRAASTFPCNPSVLADWHFRAGALDRPPALAGRASRRGFGAPGRGAETVLSVPLGPVRKQWHARIEEAIPGDRFVDVQVSGPFGAWRHEHRFEPASEGEPDASRLVDEITYRMPMRPFGDLGSGIARRDLEKLFGWRHWRTRMDLARHASGGRPAAPGRGHRLQRPGGAAARGVPSTGGHDVRTLVRRSPDRDAGEYRWNPEAGSIDAAAFEDVDAVVHLAGAGIADQRWTDERMREIRESRTRGTDLVARTIAGLDRKPDVLVSASCRRLVRESNRSSRRRFGGG